MLIRDESIVQIVINYPEFDNELNPAQSTLFRQNVNVTSVEDTIIGYRKISSGSKILFAQLLTLLKFEITN